MVAMVQPADLVACSHHLLAVAETKAARAEALAVCSHRSLALAINTAAPVAVFPASSHPFLEADRAVVVCSARVALTRTAQGVLKATTAPRRRLQARPLKAMEAISSLAMVCSRQRASSQAITMRTLQLINRAMRCLMPSHLSRITVGPTAATLSSRSRRTAMVKEVTDSKDTTVGTSMVRVAKVVDTRSTGE